MSVERDATQKSPVSSGLHAQTQSERRRAMAAILSTPRGKMIGIHSIPAGGGGTGGLAPQL